MAYKRYFYRNGKKFGPYYYESYRDENGDVKKRYIGTENPEKKKFPVGKLVLGGLVLFAVVAIFFVSLQMSDGENFSFGNEKLNGIVDSVRGFASSSILRIVGFVIDDGDESQDGGGDEEVAPQEEASDEEVPTEIVEEVDEEIVDVGLIGGAEEIDVLQIDDEVEVIEEENESVLEEVEDENESVEVNESVDVEVNESVVEEVNVTEEMNESVVEEVENLSVSVKQYKAVVGRRVKWVKKIVVDKSGNVSVEIPLSAEDITIKTGNEISEDEVEEYNNLISEVDRGDIADGTITGFVAKDIRGGRGILTRLWIWIRGFTISGNVIDEIEMESDGNIIETDDSKIIDLNDVVDEELLENDEARVAVEYYTEAPTVEESIIENGKRVVVSAGDDLNYTDILAYTLLDNRVEVNSSRLKIYHVVSIAQDEAEKNLSQSDDLDEVEKKDEEEKDEVVENASVEIGVDEDVNASVELNESVEIVDEEIKEKKNKSEEKEKKNKSEVVENLSLVGISGNVVLDEAGQVMNVSEVNKSVDYVRVEVDYVGYDLDGDGFVDYVEWIVPHLSNQTYEIIYIGGAEHLDENRSFVEDVYENVSVLGDNKSAVIPDGDYLRVVFEKNLTRTKDITIYARAGCNESILINGVEVPCEIYEKKMRIDELRREVMYV